MSATENKMDVIDIIAQLEEPTADEGHPPQPLAASARRQPPADPREWDIDDLLYALDAIGQQAAPAMSTTDCGVAHEEREGLLEPAVPHGASAEADERTTRFQAAKARLRGKSDG